MTSPIDREARARGRLLSATSNVTPREARAVAFAELGFSASGTADRAEQAEGTVKRYWNRAAVQYGHEAIVPKPAAERGETRLEPITEDEVMAYPRRTRQWWLATAADHHDMAPDWAYNIIEGGEA